MVFEINLLELNARKQVDQEKSFALSREGISKSVHEDYYERVQCVNKFSIGAIIMSHGVLAAIKRDLRKLSTGIKVDIDEIERKIRYEVLKRDILEGDEALKAQEKIGKLEKKSTRQTRRRRTRKKLDDSGKSERPTINLAEEE